MAKKKAKSTGKAQLDVGKYAQDFGYQLAFLKSDPSLYKFFLEAVKKNLSPSEFQVQLMKTDWWRKHSQTYRSNMALYHADPATYQQQLSAKQANVTDMARAMGASLNAAGLHNIANSAILFGWDDSQIRDHLASYITIKNGSGTGAAGDLAQALQQTALKNGVRVSDGWLQMYARAVANGDSTLEDAQRVLREHYGAALAPGFAKQLKAGMDLQDLASPYIQSMANLLELNPSEINLFDPTLRSALNTKDAKGNATTASLSDFENTLRNDSRYMKTQGAQDAVMSVGHKVLQDMGVTF